MRCAGNADAKSANRRLPQFKTREAKKCKRKASIFIAESGLGGLVSF
jgi:hypothetical protein